MTRDGLTILGLVLVVAGIIVFFLRSWWLGVLLVFIGLLLTVTLDTRVR